MTAIAAIATKRFVVVVGDTLWNEEGKSRYGAKIQKLTNGIAIGGAGESGPLARRMKSDPKWRSVESFDDLFVKIASLHELIDKAQLDLSATNPEALMAASVEEGIVVTDVYGSHTVGIPIKHGHSVLPATMECVGCGRNAVIGYVNGYLSAMTVKDARIELQSAQRVESLLRDAIMDCMRYDWAVAGPLESIVLR